MLESVTSNNRAMRLERLGCMHPSRLSFSRSLLRRIMKQQWIIECETSELDEDGYGEAIYCIETGQNRYSFVVFSQYLPDHLRDDRVIAEQWDVTMALCMGKISEQQLADMRNNVPKQEAGRMQPTMLVLSRGNKSTRNFAYVVDCLAKGEQPDVEQLTRVGYLYRTTAVYGSGKFGLADWQKVQTCCPEFAYPFAAEMFSCYMLRQFSLEQVERLAKRRAPQTAVPLASAIKRFLGIGNATGLGMAPYLIRHPKLISRWVKSKQQALQQIVLQTPADADSVAKLQAILDKAHRYYQQTFVEDLRQQGRNKGLMDDLQGLIRQLNTPPDNWNQLLFLLDDYSKETQELVYSALLELFPEQVDEFENNLTCDETYTLVPEQSLQELLDHIRTHYNWALDYDYCETRQNHYFWYRSEEKMEPRIGERFNEPGAERELPLLIAKQVQCCYQLANEFLSENANAQVGEFVFAHPAEREWVARIQDAGFEEIQANLAHIDMLPLDLLRCKLAFFGVGKFDPKSKLWVRNTMFQGAPLIDDIGEDFADDWYFPLAPGS